MVEALRYPRFRRYFAARAVSQWGDTCNLVGLVVLVFRLTGSGLDVCVGSVPSLMRGVPRVGEGEKAGPGCRRPPSSR